MAMTLNMEGKIIFDDQLSELIDLLLNVRGVAMVYRMDGDITWMRIVGDDTLRAALKKLPYRQRQFIEAMAFDGLSQYEVMVRHHMTDEEIYDAMEALQKSLAGDM